MSALFADETVAESVAAVAASCAANCICTSPTTADVCPTASTAVLFTSHRPILFGPGNGSPSATKVVLVLLLWVVVIRFSKY